MTYTKDDEYILCWIDKLRENYDSKPYSTPIDWERWDKIVAPIRNKVMNGKQYSLSKPKL